MPIRIRVASLWLPVVAHMTLIFVLSSIRQPPAPPFGGADKVVHGAMYALLAALFVRALAGGSLRAVTPRIATLSIIYTTMYGISDEVHQLFVPPRSPELADLVVDVLGALVAAGALYALAARMRAAERRL